MGVSVKLDVHIDINKLAKQFKACVDDKSMLEIHEIFADMCRPYVPMYTGALDESVQIYKDHILYPGPYAHYQYVGEVYGPNIPIFEDGVLVGFWSPPGKGTKKPTGRQIQYNKEKHSRATKEWDKAMMAERGDEFIEAVKRELTERINELNNG